MTRPLTAPIFQVREGIARSVFRRIAARTSVPRKKRMKTSVKGSVSESASATVRNELPQKPVAATRARNGSTGPGFASDDLSSFSTEGASL